MTGCKRWDDDEEIPIPKSFAEALANGWCVNAMRPLEHDKGKAYVWIYHPESISITIEAPVWLAQLIRLERDNEKSKLQAQLRTLLGIGDKR